jgi:quercetin dioxygenase-like cupin family protein
MDRQPSVVRLGEGETLSVIGAGVRFLCSAGQTGHAWSLMENSVPKDMGPGPHHHPWDEAYYVISGEIEFTVEGRAVQVGPGDFLYAPGGTVHAFRGVSDEPARMLIFDAPAHAESFFKDVHREVRDMPRDLEKMPVLGARHGITFLPPAA